MKHNLKLFAVAGLMTALLSAACNKNSNPQAPADNLSNEVILKWNDVAYQAMGGPTPEHFLLSSRIYAMMHVAMHDAVNATQSRFETYAYHKKDVGANPEVAAASAAHQVLKITIPAKQAFLDSVLNSYLSAIQQTDAKTKGLTLGIETANAIINLGHNSNAAENPIGQPAPAVKPGDYKVYPPFNFIYVPFWENSKLFSLTSKDQFRCPPPPALTSNDYTVAFTEISEVGVLNSATRTADQSAFAKYWYELSQDGWNRIGRITASQKKTGLFATARLFALLNFAIADAYTAGWDSKLHYNFWRPFTAVREAANDGNSATTGDVSWEPAEPTPPIQDYPSTHSALGNAASTVLAKILGDATSFSMASPSALPAGSSRSFTSFSQAANENANSRVMAGIHFRFSCVAGQDLGTRIGKWTVDNHLKPLQ